MQKEAALARALAEQIRDPASKKRAFDAIDDFERCIPQLVQALKETLENPNDKNARKRFDNVIDNIKDSNNRIAREILEDQLAKNNELLRKKLADLQDAVRRGDAREVAELLKDIADAVARRVELGRQLANTVKDPALRKQILDACDDLERLMPELVIAAREAVQNPNDAAAQERLRKIIQEMKDAADRITSLKRFPDKQDNNKGKLSGSFLQMGSNIKDRDHTAEDVLATGNRLNQEIERLRDAVHRGDPKAAAAAAKEVADLMNRQIELGRRLASQCEDPELKKKILDACDELERLVPLVVNAVKDALMNPDDQEKQRRLDRLLDQAKAANKVIMDAAEQMRTSKKKINDIAANMKDKMNYLDTKIPESRFDGSKDQIMFAANEVSRAVKAAKPVSPEQKLLIEIVAAIAAEMEQLSLAGQRRQKKEMVTSARKIAGMVDKVQSLATQIATNCKDPILRDQLLSLCRVPKNFAVQLKIISAVKASSGDDDAAAEAQLITCAKGLANSVVSTLTAAESAAIP
jgi:bacterioferritin (cytochrome b1)